MVPAGEGGVFCLSAIRQHRNSTSGGVLTPASGLVFNHESAALNVVTEVNVGGAPGSRPTCDPLMAGSVNIKHSQVQNAALHVSLPLVELGSPKLFCPISPPHDVTLLWLCRISGEALSP